LPFEEGPSDETKAEPATENLEKAETEEELEEVATEEELEEVAEGGAKKSDADLEWEQRKLCVDESCIGVIGPDGRCKECGKPYET